MNNKASEVQGEGCNRPHNPPPMFSTGNSNTNFATPEVKDQYSRAMKRLRDTIFELAGSNQTLPLSMERTEHIEARLRQIFPEICTPDHPPYSEMIYKAIEELNEEGGSNEGSISSYIKSQYHDLPWAHNGLLSHHLGKLTQSGELVVTPNSCYLLELLPKPNPASPNPKTRQQQRQRGRPRTKPEELEQEVLQPEEMEQQQPEQRKGRPSLKSKPIMGVKVQQAKLRGRGKMHVGIMLSPQPKRKGRPPKPKPTPTHTVTTTSMETVPSDQEQQPIKALLSTQEG